MTGPSRAQNRFLCNRDLTPGRSGTSTRASARPVLSQAMMRANATITFPQSTGIPAAKVPPVKSPDSPVWPMPNVTAEEKPVLSESYRRHLRPTNTSSQSADTSAMVSIPLCLRHRHQCGCGSRIGRLKITAPRNTHFTCTRSIF